MVTCDNKLCNGPDQGTDQGDECAPIGYAKGSRIKFIRFIQAGWLGLIVFTLRNWDTSGVWPLGWQGGGGRVPLLTEKNAKNREKEKKKKTGKIGKNLEKSGKKEEKSGRKGKNRDVSFTLPLLTDRAGYATVRHALFIILVI